MALIAWVSVEVLLKKGQNFVPGIFLSLTMSLSVHPTGSKLQRKPGYTIKTVFQLILSMYSNQFSVSKPAKEPLRKEAVVHIFLINTDDKVKLNPMKLLSITSLITAGLNWAAKLQISILKLTISLNVIFQLMYNLYSLSLPT